MKKKLDNSNELQENSFNQELELLEKEVKNNRTNDNQKHPIDKNNALNELPEITKVTNQHCIIGGKRGVYTGSRYQGETNCYPCGGEGKFVSDDGEISINGKWNEKGQLKSKSGKLFIRGIEYNIGKVYYRKDIPTTIYRIEGTNTYDGLNYSCGIDGDFKIKYVTYKGITLNLTYGKYAYLINKHGDKCKIGFLDGYVKRPYCKHTGHIRHVRYIYGNLDTTKDIKALYVAELIAKVKESGRELKYFSFTDDRQITARYKHSLWGVRLHYRYYLASLDEVRELSDWLNKSRSDFDI